MSSLKLPNILLAIVVLASITVLMAMKIIPVQDGLPIITTIFGYSTGTVTTNYINGNAAAAAANNAATSTSAAATAVTAAAHATTAAATLAAPSQVIAAVNGTTIPGTTNGPIPPGA